MRRSDTSRKYEAANKNNARPGPALPDINISRTAKSRKRGGEQWRQVHGGLARTGSRRSNGRDASCPGRP